MTLDDRNYRGEDETYGDRSVEKAGFKDRDRAASDDGRNDRELDFDDGSYERNTSVDEGGPDLGGRASAGFKDGLYQGRTSFNGNARAGEPNFRSGYGERDSFDDNSYNTGAGLADGDDGRRRLDNDIREWEADRRTDLARTDSDFEVDREHWPSRRHEIDREPDLDRGKVIDKAANLDEGPALERETDFDHGKAADRYADYNTGLVVDKDPSFHRGSDFDSEVDDDMRFETIRGADKGKDCRKDKRLEIDEEPNVDDGMHTVERLANNDDKHLGDTIHHDGLCNCSKCNLGGIHATLDNNDEDEETLASQEDDCGKAVAASENLPYIDDQYYKGLIHQEQDGSRQEKAALKSARRPSVDSDEEERIPHGDFYNHGNDATANERELPHPNNHYQMDAVYQKGRGDHGKYVTAESNRYASTGGDGQGAINPDALHEYDNYVTASDNEPPYIDARYKKGAVHPRSPCSHEDNTISDSVRQVSTRDGEREMAPTRSLHDGNRSLAAEKDESPHINKNFYEDTHQHEQNVVDVGEQPPPGYPIIQDNATSPPHAELPKTTNNVEEYEVPYVEDQYHGSILQQEKLRDRAANGTIDAAQQPYYKQPANQQGTASREHSDLPKDSVQSRGHKLSYVDDNEQAGSIDQRGMNIGAYQLPHADDQVEGSPVHHDDRNAGRQVLPYLHAEEPKSAIHQTGTIASKHQLSDIDKVQKSVVRQEPVDAGEKLLPNIDDNVPKSAMHQGGINVGGSQVSRANLKDQKSSASHQKGLDTGGLQLPYIGDTSQNGSFQKGFTTSNEQLPGIDEKHQKNVVPKDNVTASKKALPYIDDKWNATAAHQEDTDADEQELSNSTHERQGGALPAKVLDGKKLPYTNTEQGLFTHQKDAKIGGQQLPYGDDNHQKDTVSGISTDDKELPYTDKQQRPFTHQKGDNSRQPAPGYPILQNTASSLPRSGVPEQAPTTVKNFSHHLDSADSNQSASIPKSTPPAGLRPGQATNRYANKAATSTKNRPAQGSVPSGSGISTRGPALSSKLSVPPETTKPSSKPNSAGAASLEAAPSDQSSSRDLGGSSSSFFGRSFFHPLRPHKKDTLNEPDQETKSSGTPNTFATRNLGSSDPAQANLTAKLPPKKDATGPRNHESSEAFNSSKPLPPAGLRSFSSKEKPPDSSSSLQKPFQQSTSSEASGRPNTATRAAPSRTNPARHQTPFPATSAERPSLPRSSSGEDKPSSSGFHFMRPFHRPSSPAEDSDHKLHSGSSNKFTQPDQPLKTGRGSDSNQKPEKAMSEQEKGWSSKFRFTRPFHRPFTPENTASDPAATTFTASPKPKSRSQDDLEIVKPLTRSPSAGAKSNDERTSHSKFSFTRPFHRPSTPPAPAPSSTTIKAGPASNNPTGAFRRAPSPLRSRSAPADDERKAASSKFGFNLPFHKHSTPAERSTPADSNEVRSGPNSVLESQRSNQSKSSSPRFLSTNPFHRSHSPSKPITSLSGDPSATVSKPTFGSAQSTKQVASPANASDKLGTTRLGNAQAARSINDSKTPNLQQAASQNTQPRAAPLSRPSTGLSGFKQSMPRAANPAIKPNETSTLSSTSATPQPRTVSASAQPSGYTPLKKDAASTSDSRAPTPTPGKSSSALQATNNASTGAARQHANPFAFLNPKATAPVTNVKSGSSNNSSSASVQPNSKATPGLFPPSKNYMKSFMGSEPKVTPMNTTPAGPPPDNKSARPVPNPPPSENKSNPFVSGSTSKPDRNKSIPTTGGPGTVPHPAGLNSSKPMGIPAANVIAKDSNKVTNSMPPPPNKPAPPSQPAAASATSSKVGPSFIPSMSSGSAPGQSTAPSVGSNAPSKTGPSFGPNASSKGVPGQGAAPVPQPPSNVTMRPGVPPPRAPPPTIPPPAIPAPVPPSKAGTDVSANLGSKSTSGKGNQAPVPANDEPAKRIGGTFSGIKSRLTAGKDAPSSGWPTPGLNKGGTTNSSRTPLQAAPRSNATTEQTSKASAAKPSFSPFAGLASKVGSGTATAASAPAPAPAKPGNNIFSGLVSKPTANRSPPASNPSTVNGPSVPSATTKTSKNPLANFAAKAGPAKGSPPSTNAIGGSSAPRPNPSTRPPPPPQGGQNPMPSAAGPAKAEMSSQSKLGAPPQVQAPKNAAPTSSASGSSKAPASSTPNRGAPSNAAFTGPVAGSFKAPVSSKPNMAPPPQVKAPTAASLPSSAAGPSKASVFSKPNMAAPSSSAFPSSTAGPSTKSGKPAPAPSAKPTVPAASTGPSFNLGSLPKMTKPTSAKNVSSAAPSSAAAATAATAKNNAGPSSGFSMMGRSMTPEKSSLSNGRMAATDQSTGSKTKNMPSSSSAAAATNSSSSKTEPSKAKAAKSNSPDPKSKLTGKDDKKKTAAPSSSQPGKASKKVAEKVDKPTLQKQESMPKQSKQSKQSKAGTAVERGQKQKQAGGKATASTNLKATGGVKKSGKIK